MKILFAADTSFNFIESGFSGNIMEQTAQCFRAADFSVLNLENIFGKKEEHTPILKAGPNLISDESLVEVIDVLNPTVVGLANNHSRDFGDAPMLQTKELLLQKGYQAIGVGKNLEEAYQPAILEKDGLKVAIIAACENEFGAADAKQAGTAGYQLGMVTKAIFDAKEAGALPIIYFHGGNEINPLPSPRKKELYRHFIDLGAAAVIAMHTHCPQGNEYYRGSPIIYSMGNFFFPQKDMGNKAKSTWNIGYMTMLDISREGCKAELIPYSFDWDHHTLMSGEKKQAFLDYIEEISAPIADDALLQQYFDGWSMMMGPKYLGYLSSSLDLEPGQLARLKNSFSCEAHNEMIGNYIKIHFEGRQEQAKEKIPQIEQWQNKTF
ncbi:MAG: CapA family protein [Clostridia bacterium]|nr:CapA family protein [Clostridia bacterium]